MILLDSSVLSLAFRRRRRPAPPPLEVTALEQLIAEDAPLALPGIVLQEVLSGVRSKKQSGQLNRVLAGFSIRLAEEEDHRRAAEIVNDCRRAGIICASIDALIAAQTIGMDGELFTLDRDFQRIPASFGLRLYTPQP